MSSRAQASWQRTSSTPLAERLEHEFPALVSERDGLAGLLRVPSGVPDDVWERAVVAPVREILARPGKGFRSRLVEVAYHIAGGVGAPPPELALAIEAIHAGSMVVDDIEDGSTERRGAPALHVMYGVPTALNAGNFLYFWPFELLAAAGLSRDAELELRRVMTRAMTSCHLGQALDLDVHIGDVPQDALPSIVARTTDLKTGSLTELAAEMGAIAAGAPPAVRAAVARFGRRLGVGLQMLDDLGNLRGTRAGAKRHEDLRLGRPTWPWAWAAESLDEVTFASFEARARQVRRAGRNGSGATAGLDELAADLLAIVVVTRRAFVHDFLVGALSDLQRAVGACESLAHIENEIARLEASY